MSNGEIKERKSNGIIKKKKNENLKNNGMGVNKNVFRWIRKKNKEKGKERKREGTSRREKGRKEKQVFASL